MLDPRLNKIGELGPGRTGIVVDRHVLRHLLLTGLTVHTGAALTGYEVLADGRVEARFADRDPATADLLVGADGVGSAVRAVLSPQTTPDRHRRPVRHRPHAADRAVRRPEPGLRLEDRRRRREPAARRHALPHPAEGSGRSSWRPR